MDRGGGMRKETFTCDVCGREVTKYDEYVFRMPAMWRMGHAEFEKTERYDLCDKHAKQAAKILEKGWEVTFREMTKRREED